MCRACGVGDALVMGPLAGECDYVPTYPLVPLRWHCADDLSVVAVVVVVVVVVKEIKMEASAENRRKTGRAKEREGLRKTRRWSVGGGKRSQVQVECRASGVGKGGRWLLSSISPSVSQVQEEVRAQPPPFIRSYVT